VAVVGLFFVLDVADSHVIHRREHEPLHRSGGECTTKVVVVAFAAERVAAALGHRADDAAKRAAELRGDADGLDLYFLEVLEDGVLPGLAIQQAVGRHAVHGELILRTAGTVHLQAPFDDAGIDRRRRHCH
jgi:hypothetical protein